MAAAVSDAVVQWKRDIETFSWFHVLVAFLVVDFAQWQATSLRLRRPQPQQLSEQPQPPARAESGPPLLYSSSTIVNSNSRRDSAGSLHSALPSSGSPSPSKFVARPLASVYSDMDAAGTDRYPPSEAGIAGLARGNSRGPLRLSWPSALGAFQRKRTAEQSAAAASAGSRRAATRAAATAEAAVRLLEETCKRSVPALQPLLLLARAEAAATPARALEALRAARQALGRSGMRPFEAVACARIARVHAHLAAEAQAAARRERREAGQLRELSRAEREEAAK
eukprot:tig00001017_g6256.t1